MRKNFFFMAALAAGALMTSCSNDENAVSEVTAQGGKALNVQSVGVTAAGTRAGITATAFTGTETIGLFIYRGAGINDASKDYNSDNSEISTTNVPYALSNGTWSATQPIVLSNVLGKVYGYYPYSGNNDENDGTSIAISVAATQGTGQSDGKADVTEQADYMYSTVVENVSNKSNSVELTMNHALAMVSFKFVNSTDETVSYPGDGKVSSIVLANGENKEIIKTGDATLNISTGAISVTGNAGSITLSPDDSEALIDVDDADKLPRLLMYPTDATQDKDLKLTVTVDGTAYTVELPAQTGGYEPGNNYVYTLELKGTSLVVSSVAITEWVEKAQDNIDVQNPDTAA